MDFWSLPGPARFLRQVERTLWDGANVVVLFPFGGMPNGFRDQMLSLVRRVWHCVVFEPEMGELPLEGLLGRFAPRRSSAGCLKVLDLCEHEEFHSRVIWLDSLNRLDKRDLLEWKGFLVDYAQASRGVPELKRSLFIAVLEGALPIDLPEEDVTLKLCDWRGVVDEMDLLFFACSFLQERDLDQVVRALLATTVARVAVWDFEVAKRLLDEDSKVILNPRSMLRSFASEKEWTSHTTPSWELGTASEIGMLHAALTALEDPPRQLQRRRWSAQASVLLPVFEDWRYSFLLKHRNLLTKYLSGVGDQTDPLDLDVGMLVGVVEHAGFGYRTLQHVRKMKRWRNGLAHLKPLSPNDALALAAQQ